MSGSLFGRDELTKLLTFGVLLSLLLLSRPRHLQLSPGFSADFCKCSRRRIALHRVRASHCTALPVRTRRASLSLLSRQPRADEPCSRCSMSELLADDHSNNPLGAEGGYSHTSTTSTVRPLATKQHSSALSTRRHSATSYNAAGNISSRQPIRPTPQPPRSPLIPPRPSSRPSSPPSRPSARYPSPPTRAQSVMTGVNRSNAAGPHAQQTLAELNGPKPEELVQFADLCRRLYYDQDAGAGEPQLNYRTTL